MEIRRENRSLLLKNEIKINIVFKTINYPITSSAFAITTITFAPTPTTSSSDLQFFYS